MVQDRTFLRDPGLHQRSHHRPLHIARHAAARAGLALLCAAVFAACGGGGGDDNGPPVPPLTLQSSTPAAGATGVDRSAALTLGFSAPLDVSTVAANVTLTRAGVAVPATAAGSGASVTVTPQAPLMPLASYTLAAAAGLRGQGGQTLGTAASVSFTTRDGAWQGAQPISPTDGSALAPGSSRIATDASGNALAIWMHHDGKRDSIWANRYTAGTGWGTAAPIEAGDGGARDPQIAIDANGNALAIWAQYDGTRHNIWANRYTAGTGWGTAVMVERHDGRGAYYPQIAFDAAGNALAVWLQDNETSESIRASRYTAAAGWGTAALIANQNDGFMDEPRVAIDAHGNAFAVWGQYDGSLLSLWASRYTAAGGWGAAARIESNDAGNAISPQIAIDADGNALAVWNQFDGTRYSAWANRYTAGAGWGTAAVIGSGHANGAFGAQIAVDAGGNALAVWAQSDGTRFNIWANRYTVGAGWGTAAMIESDNGGAAHELHLAIDANGNALAVWAQSDGARINAWAGRYAAGAGWGAPTLIESDNAGNVFGPRVAIDARGNAMALWRQFDGTRYRVVANRLQ